MSGIDGYLIDDQQQRSSPLRRQRHRQQQQQQDTHSANALSLSLGNMSNMSRRDQNETTGRLLSNFDSTTLTYKISLGLICACLCLLTVTGNFLVLITFRRLRTVSIRLWPAATIEFPLMEVVSRRRSTCHLSLMTCR